MVKAAMGHGDLPIDAYSQVWEECYNQVRAGALCEREREREEGLSNTVSGVVSAQGILGLCVLCVGMIIDLLSELL